MKNYNKIGMMIAVLPLLIGPAVYIRANAQTLEPRAAKVRIAVRDRDIYGELFVTIGGTETKVTDQAQQAWIINGGRHVVYSCNEGAGGYENEGQSLHLYDVNTGNHKRIMSQYFMIQNVKEVITSKQKRAQLVTMEDGGLGASYLALVDPWRGEVFFRRWVRLLAKKGDTIVLGSYREKDWGELEPGKKVRPYKTERQNLSALLQRPVIANKKEQPFDELWCLGWESTPKVLHGRRMLSPVKMVQPNLTKRYKPSIYDHSSRQVPLRLASCQPI